MENEQQLTEKEALIQLQIARAERSEACRELYARRKNLPEQMQEYLLCKYRVSQAYKVVERAELALNRVRVSSTLPAIDIARRADSLAIREAVKKTTIPIPVPQKEESAKERAEYWMNISRQLNPNAPTLDDIDLDSEEDSTSVPEQ